VKLQGRWLVQGYFDLSDRDGGQSITQHVRNCLADRLGRPRTSVRIKSYPVGPAWRHTVWWREGKPDYAETQFFARIAEEYPVLSVGISVEKGYGPRDAAPAGVRASEVMDPNTWDWRRFTERAADIMGADVPACAALLSRPLALRFFAFPYARGGEAVRERRTFVFHDGTWSERHAGTATVDAIIAYVGHLDERHDWWVDAHIACDLTPVEVDGMSAEALAALLWDFAVIRRRLRSEGG
jgi:hypothetical protein